MGAQLASRGCQRAATLSGAESSDMMQSAIEDGEEDAMGTTSQQTSAGIPTKRLIGVLQSVPVISTSKEHLSSAIKRSAKLAYAAGLKNEAEKERNRAARQMDTLMKELSVPLTRYVGAFPQYQRLHPFEQALLELTVGRGNYETILAKVDSLRKSIQETGKGYAAKANKATNKAGAIQVATEGLEHLVNMFSSGARHVEALREVSRKLRSLPLVNVALPTVALVGAPNVGKSSLVKLLSTGTPEVCNYPFTTRSIKMGHFYIDGKRHQVTDTPGLLNREDHDRNKMELLTLSVLQHLPSTVLFVVDLTEECGTSVEDQWEIRAEVQRRFPDRPWVDVFSKSDVLVDILSEGRSGQEAPLAAAASSNGHGSRSESATARSQVGEPSSSAGDGIDGPPDFVRRLPGALAVSSLTEEGVDGLKDSLMDLLSRHYETREEGWEDGDGGSREGTTTHQQSIIGLQD